MTFAFAALAFAALAAGAPSSQHVVDQGIGIDFSTTPARAGEPVAFEFRLRDTATGAPIGGVRPAAWLSRRRAGAAAPDCKREVVTFLGADLVNRADVDLNAYYVLALGADNTISVVDPLFGFGGSQLLDMLVLRSPGADWALAAEDDRLFVSMPDSDKIAVADTRHWRIVKEIDTAAHPRRVLAVGARIVVADDAGMTVVDEKTLAASHVDFGAARELAASEDGNTVFAASGEGVVRVDLRHTRSLVRAKLDAAPGLVAYSTAAKAVYAVDAERGRVFAIDARSMKLLATVDVAPGAAQLRFAPDGRRALLANPQRGLVQVLDAATNRIVQTGDVDGAPDRIAYTDLVAYVHRRDSESVLMIPLDALGSEGKAIDAGDFPAGQHALGAGGLADAIVPAPDGPAVLVPNQADRMIYLYKEGMAAPAGGFSTGGHAPRAALVVDHGLRERARGDYATTVPVDKPGTYDVAMFLDSPRVIACFAINVEGEAPASGPKTRVVAVDPPRRLARGAPARLEFALTDAERGTPRRADDVRALVFEAPGVWQERAAAKRGADGRYEVDFVPPDAGTYYVWIESEALGLGPRNAQFSVYEAD